MKAPTIFLHTPSCCCPLNRQTRCLRAQPPPNPAPPPKEKSSKEVAAAGGRAAEALERLALDRADDVPVIIRQLLEGQNVARGEEGDAVHVARVLHEHRLHEEVGLRARGGASRESRTPSAVCAAVAAEDERSDGRYSAIRGIVLWTTGSHGRGGVWLWWRRLAEVEVSGCVGGGWLWWRRLAVLEASG